MASIYERIGGAAAVTAAVDIFYNKMLADPRVNYWFAHMDMQAQRKKQETFLTMAFGGPSLYSGVDMYSAHIGLVAKGLNDVHMDALGENLTATLRELSVPEPLIDEIMALVETLRDVVLCRVKPGDSNTVPSTKYVLAKREQVTPTDNEGRFNVRLTFEAAAGESEVRVKPGNYVRVSADIDGNHVVRSYTPQPSDSGLVLLVKVYTHGLMSKFLGSMAIGESINVRGPFGHYNYEPNSHNQVNMIACGSGITPMYQVLHSIANNADDTTATRLLYGNKSENDIALKQELDQLATKLGESRMHVTHALTEPTAEWSGSRSRIGAGLMQVQCFAPSDSTINLICGTNEFSNAIRKQLKDLGHSDASIIIF